MRVSPCGQKSARALQLFWYAVVVAITSVVLSTLTAASAAAQGSDGLEVVSSIQYEPDPVAEDISVTATYTLTNRTPDEIVDDGVRSFFYTKWVVAMPATATDFVATSDGQPLTATVEVSPDSDDVSFGHITLPYNLNYEQTVRIDVAFTIPGSDPRESGTVARVNDSFLSFSVWAAGDPGRTDVRILIPEGFTVDLQGDLDELQEVVTADGLMLEAIGIQAPQDFFGQIYGRNDRGLLTETAELPGATATIRAWPDDPEWADFVAEAIEDDVPIIEDLTGLDWPAGDIVVIETVTPYLFGYGGWFNASSGVIEIGDSLERDLILHELSHGWFNDQLVDGRWITEGLAEEYASRAIEATGGELDDPTPPDLDNPLRVPLAAWSSPWTLDEEDAFDYEQFHYNAAWWVMRQITNDIGLDAFAEVLVALSTDEIPYRGDGPVEQTIQSTRWTHLYDLLDERGATGLDELFRDYVLTESDWHLLDERREARARYRQLASDPDGWSPPLALRRAMASWQFDDAQALIDIAAAMLTARDELRALGSSLEITVDHSIEMAYETALDHKDLAATRQELDELVASLVSVQEQRDELTGSALASGTTVAFPAMTYDQAIADLADQRAALTSVLALRDQVETAAATLQLTAPVRPASGPVDLAAAAALAEARLATLAAIEQATIAIDAPRGLTERIGLIGRDPAAHLRNARRSFESDDLDDAFAATAMAESMLDSAAEIGRTRLIWGAVAGLFILLAAGSLTARRRATAGRRTS